MTNLSKVGKYEVQDLVGEGAMGVVYRALDPMLNRSVAVKVMNDALALDESFRTRFLREARAAGSLQHPNVVTVYDCGETDGHLYIAMEFVSGTDLEQLINSKIPVSLADKIDIIVGVLNGLAYAHKRGIVHRDMKPANIRVNEEGRALIMDFGIAHTASSNVTKTGLILGTPNYMAPEQVTGNPITPQTDIFAVGVVLYELLTDIKPFEGGTLHNVLFRIVGETPTRPDELVAGLRTDLVDIVMKAMAKEPEQRYASALEMASALTRVSSSLRSGQLEAGSQTLSLRSSIELALHQEKQEKEKEKNKEQDDRQKMGRRAAVAAAVVVAIGAVLLFRRGGDIARDVQTPMQQSATNGAKPAPSSGTPSTAITPAAPPQTVPPVVAPPASSASPRAPAKADAAVADMTLARSLQSSAQQSRRRAADAGATTAQLALGDRRSAVGEQFLKTGQRDAAMREFTQASSAFGDAERAARLAALPAASTATTVEQPKTAAVVSTAPPPVQAPPAQPAINPSVEIESVVSQYAKAIESRDVGELRRIYPGMSSAQASAFEDFFRSVRNLRAAFSISSLQVDGTSADARLSGTYDFVTSNGKTEHQPIALRAVLRREGGAWRFASIR